MRFIKSTILICSFVFFSSQSFAWWGVTGHRVVGEIAQSYLSSSAKKAIADILGNESLAMASNWGDFIKSDSTFNYLNRWHYVNLVKGLTMDQVAGKLEQDTTHNLYNRINFLVAELKRKDIDIAMKQMYLRLLIHFIGDLHQPLHVGRPEDLGGNRIKVQWFNEPTNLHSIWDEKLPEFQRLSYTEYARSINFTTKKQRKEWQNSSLSTWFFESYQIAQGLYDEIAQPDQKLSYRYNFDHLETMNQQMLKGGVRLAGILNEIFD